MIRLFVHDDLAPGAGLALDEGQSRYLASVMRLTVGDALLVFNGRDGEWRAKVASLGKRAVTLALEARTRPQVAGPDLELVVALVKRARLETIVEKAAELGAARVRLAITERTNADHTRVDRLVAIATEAAEQTGRLDVPEIAAPMKLDRLLADWPAGRRLLFCDEAGEARPMLDVLSPPPCGEGPGMGVQTSSAEATPPPLHPSPQGGGESWAILIGPEGGFSPRERELVRGQPFVVAATLGPRILRADTAAIAALALWQAALGDWRS